MNGEGTLDVKIYTESFTLSPKNKIFLTTNKVKTSIRHFALRNANLHHHNIQQDKDRHKALRVMQYKS